MGISGLLPLLRSIQVNKHLSEFSGQILGVDAYVWLHRGVYACATELANDKKTTKYVDYAMHRIRLLRHYNIRPYVVFDGGPLPAKKGTETERKRRRDENLTRGHALSAQGKYNQAREHYVKCIDVTPQMAFQLIKALRAESIQYVVAPYEADAQLAYLERIGTVDGIITEDSDLLVFGCGTVLFKLDAVNSTVTCILRSDFASVTSAESGISFFGWSDVQFRAMAILSGCDYLPSIPGIGLKTAWSLLRKYKTPENVIRALKLEGKKDVPRKYLHDFKLAEKVFLHQRVYDPASERIVNMTPIPNGDVWDERTEAYVGLDIEPNLAKEIAKGDVDPITLLPMTDINPIYAPRAANAPLTSNAMKNSDLIQRKGKGIDRPANANILSFFPRKPRFVREDTRVRASGKRTLVEIMEQELAAKKLRNDDFFTEAVMRSRFFGTTVVSRKSQNRRSRSCDDARPSPEKENIPIPSGDLDISMEVAIGIEEPLDPVTQEDGYISPSPSYPRTDTPDISSPVRAQRSTWPKFSPDDFGVDPISSPPLTRKQRRRSRRTRSASPTPILTAVASPHGTVKRLRQDPQACREENEGIGPDLRDFFGDDVKSDVGSVEGELSGHLASPTPANYSRFVTPNGLGQAETSFGGKKTDLDLDLGLESEPADPGEAERQALTSRNETVATGWRSMWAWQEKPKPLLRRHETTITPSGRHRSIRALPRPYPPRGPIPMPMQSITKSKASFRRRRSLTFVEAARKTLNEGKDNECISSEPEADAMSDLDEDTLSMARAKLARFRCQEAI